MELRSTKAPLGVLGLSSPKMRMASMRALLLAASERSDQREMPLQRQSAGKTTKEKKDTHRERDRQDRWDTIREKKTERDKTDEIQLEKETSHHPTLLTPFFLLLHPGPPPQFLLQHTHFSTAT